MRLIDSATKMQVIQHIQLSKIKYCQNHPLPLQVNYSGAAKDGQKIVGGGERDRTDDLLRARQALSQLSYTPNPIMVGLTGLEPVTSRLSGVRSNQN